MNSESWVTVSVVVAPVAYSRAKPTMRVTGREPGLTVTVSSA